MKNILKFLSLGFLMIAFNGLAAITTNAQITPEECGAIYDKYVATRKGPEISNYETAIASGKDYLAKCKDLPDVGAQVDYVTKDLPKLEKKREVLVDQRDLYEPFNKSVPAKDWAKAFSLGKQVIAKNPDDVDVPLVLASIGYDLSVANPPVDNYNAEAVNMAKIALQKMEQGKGSGTGNFGAFNWTYKTKDCADGKLNATGWMNYTIGNIMYYRMSQKKDAVPFLYKATQAGCETKSYWDIYRMIGAWYVEETAAIEKSRQEKIKAAGDQDTDETKAMFALQKGYTERAIDAYSRAYKVAAVNPQGKKDSEGYYTRLKSLYGFRFDGKTDGLDAYINEQVAKPFPNPANAVAPVVETTPATTTTGGAMPTMTDAPSTTDTRPRTAPVTTPAKTTTTTTTTTAGGKTTTTTTTTTAASSTATTTKKAPAKKPAPKKKGTR